MTYQEYETKINEVLSNPDTALAGIAPILDEIKTDITSLETAQKENASLQERIKDLQETNIKLYLAQTGEPDKQEEEEEKEPATGEDVIKEFISEVFTEKKEED